MVDSGKGMTINRTGPHRAATSHSLTYLLTPSLLPTSAKLNFNGLITMTTFKPTRNERSLEFTPGRPISGN